MMHFNTKAPKLLCLALISGGLAACSSGGTTGGGSGGISNTGISSATVPLVSGQANAGMLPGAASDVLTDANGNGVAYALGGVGSTPTRPSGVAAAAGFLSGNDVGAVQNSGTATYNAEYGALVGYDIADTSSGYTYTPGRYEGTVALTANFDAGTLTGTNTVLAGPGVAQNEVHILTVNGTLSGAAIDGQVDLDYHDGSAQRYINGDLEGSIGADSAVGVFHGTDATTTMAGGFVGRSN